MDAFFPEDIPWLDTDDKYLAGIEVGAALMLMRLGMPMVKVKVGAMSEDQIRVAAGVLAYHVAVDQRNTEWVHLTLASKTAPEEIESHTDSDGD